MNNCLNDYACKQFILQNRIKYIKKVVKRLMIECIPFAYRLFKDFLKFRKGDKKLKPEWKFCGQISTFDI